MLDQQGTRLRGALLVFHLSNGRVTRGVSSDIGEPFATGASPGSVRINIAPPNRYTLAPGQANPVIVPVPVTTSPIIQVTVLLAKTAP